MGKTSQRSDIRTTATGCWVKKGNMKVKELIRALQAMPPEADVTHLWDGEARTDIQQVWLARGGFVVTSDFDMVCYSDDSRPSLAPTRQEDPYWHSPKEQDL